jgi:hypothetical protein
VVRCKRGWCDSKFIVYIYLSSSVAQHALDSRQVLILQSVWIVTTTFESYLDDVIFHEKDPQILGSDRLRQPRSVNSPSAS